MKPNIKFLLAFSEHYDIELSVWAIRPTDDEAYVICTRVQCIKCVMHSHCCEKTHNNILTKDDLLYVKEHYPELLI